MTGGTGGWRGKEIAWVSSGSFWCTALHSFWYVWVGCMYDQVVGAIAMLAHTRRVNPRNNRLTVATLPQTVHHTFDSFNIGE